MSVWRHIEQPEAGYAFILSEALLNLESYTVGALLPMNVGMQYILSDYSGQHKNATHEAYSFLVTTSEDLQNWLPLLDDFRKRWLPDGRRMSFKQLSESVRRRAYPELLITASQLRANLITFMVSRNIESFMHGGANSIRDTFSDCFTQIESDSSVEKRFRISYFLSLLLAGLRGERQETIWVSDNDEILDTSEKREGISRLSSYLTCGFTEWKNPGDVLFSTTGVNETPLWVEELERRSFKRNRRGFL